MRWSLARLLVTTACVLSATLALTLQPAAALIAGPWDLGGSGTNRICLTGELYKQGGVVTSYASVFQVSSGGCNGTGVYGWNGARANLLRWSGSAWVACQSAPTEAAIIYSSVTIAQARAVICSSSGTFAAVSQGRGYASGLYVDWNPIPAYQPQGVF